MYTFVNCNCGMDFRREYKTKYYIISQTENAREQSLRIYYYTLYFIIIIVVYI